MNGTSLLVMGIVSILCCPILGPVTWYLSNQALTTGTADDPGKVNIARILGIVVRVAGIGAGVTVPGQ